MRWRIGEGRAVGSFALLIALATYASPVGERTVWRWSYPDAAILGVVALIFVVTLVGLLQPATGPIDGGHRGPGSSAAAQWIDLAWVIWGLGYLIGSAFLWSSRGRLFQLDLFGSVIPGGSFLEWGGGVALLIAFLIRIWKRLSWPVALLCSLPPVALAGGEGWARWEAMYRPRVTAIPSTTDARWHQRYAPLDAAGFRDALHAVPKPEGVSRVLVLGDETPFGTGIEDPNDRISELVALRLGISTGKSWESLNFARERSDTKDQQGILTAALRYHPDAVVLLYSFDDIAYFAPVRRPEPLAAPAATWGERLHPLRLLYLNSVLFQEGYLWARSRYPAYTGGRAIPVDPYADTALVAAHLEDVQTLVLAAEETGAATLIIPLDVQVGVDPDRRARYLAFVAAAQRSGLPLLAVDSAFVGRPVGQFVLDTLDRRPNALVHRVVAELAARRLVEVMGLGKGEGL